jgi:hypothetical protein
MSVYINPSHYKNKFIKHILEIVLLILMTLLTPVVIVIIQDKVIIDFKLLSILKVNNHNPLI